MKTVALLLFLALPGVCGPLPPQGGHPTTSTNFPTRRWSPQDWALLQTNRFLMPKSATTTLFGLGDHKPAWERSIAPGVYKTLPYSMLVVVPGAHPDDKCIAVPGNPQPRMPIVKPELRFIPWRTGKKP